jgi:hypothetical protein
MDGLPRDDDFVANARGGGAGLVRAAAAEKKGGKRERDTRRPKAKGQEEHGGEGEP